MRRGLSLVLALAAMLYCAPPARALDKVTVGMAVWPLWAFLPLQVGVAEGIWPRHGIALDIVNDGSGAKLIEALTSGSIELGLSSGVEMAFAAKGAPIRAVAAFAGAPKTVAVIVTADSPIKIPADLKGKVVAMPGIGSVSQWLIWQASIAQGWGRDGIKVVSAGSAAGSLALIRSHQADAAVGPPEMGYLLAARHEGRVAFGLDQFAPHFHAHVIYARSALIARNPALVRRFLQGFFASVRFMKTHKAETTRIAVRELNSTPEIMNRTWDDLHDWLESDGHFDPQAVAVLKKSYVDLKILDREPSDDQILTRQFVPVTP